MVSEIIPQDGSYTYTVGTAANPTVISTAGKTVSVRVKAMGTLDVPTALGSASGAAAGTNIAVTLDTSLVAPGLYELEAVADVGQTNPITLIPNATVGHPYVVHIVKIGTIEDT